MKSKSTTYLLIVAVVAVWGVIAWKMIGSGRGADAPAPAQSLQSAHSSVPDTLLLNYRDPFLGVGRKAAPDPGPQLILKPLVPAPAPKKAVKHNLKYLGCITQHGKVHSLVEINNMQHTMTAGQTEDGYRLARIFPDSVHFSFDGEMCCIKLSL